MARNAENAGLMEGSGGATRLGAPHDSERDLAALRDHVERTIARSPKLSGMAERIGLTPADVASEALARFLRVGDDEIENPAGWMVGAGRNFIFDQHRKGLDREIAWEPGSHALDTPRAGEQPPIEETLDRRYENKLYDAAVRRLDQRDQRAIAAFEVAGSMRAVEKEYGIPKSSVQRAFKRLQAVISSETGREATRRARSRALAYHLGYMSPPQAAEMKARLSWDTGLLMAVRSLELGGRRAVALLPPAALARGAPPEVHGFADRLAAMGDRLRDGVQSLAIRGTGHEAEAAGGVATGSAGLATKAIVVACIGGSAAAGVGGACVATGVVDLPGDNSKPTAERTVPDTNTATTITPTVTQPSVPSVGDPASEQTATTAENPVQAVSKELYGGGSSSSSSGSTSGSRDFAAPASSSTSSGSGGGGSSSGRDNFGP
jgi:DNA-directed RNA polymerase specialized sigma24 family protein